MCIYAVWDDSKVFKFVPENMRGTVLAKMPYEFRTYTGILWWKVLEEKIPRDLIEAIEKAKDKNYIYKYKPGIPLNQQDLLPETKSLLSVIYSDYLCNENVTKPGSWLTAWFCLKW